MPHDDVAVLVERFAAVWLQGTDLGQNILGAMTLDQAIDAIFEALNAGLIKISKAPDGSLNGFTLCNQPCPPKRVIIRPGRFVQ